MRGGTYAFDPEGQPLAIFNKFFGTDNPYAALDRACPGGRGGREGAPGRAWGGVGCLLRLCYPATPAIFSPFSKKFFGADNRTPLT